MCIGGVNVPRKHSITLEERLVEEDTWGHLGPLVVGEVEVAGSHVAGMGEDKYT